MSYNCTFFVFLIGLGNQILCQLNDLTTVDVWQSDSVLRPAGQGWFFHYSSVEQPEDGGFVLIQRPPLTVKPMWHTRRSVMVQVYYLLVG